MLLGIAAVASLAAIARPLLFASLQPELAEAKGVSLRLLSVLFLAIVALAVAECAQIVGVLLVFALMVGPAASAQRLTTKFWSGTLPVSCAGAERSLSRACPGILHGLANQFLDNRAEQRGLSDCGTSREPADGDALSGMSVTLPRLLVRHLPFFYGWIVLVCACCAGFSRQGGAVATLSIFVEPMTRDFGWSRTALSGAVSLGGVLAALLSPMIGRLLDRSGARLVLCLAVLTTGGANILLSLTDSLSMFYLLFCVARTNFAGPFDLGIYGAVNNWFVSRRTFATAIATIAQMAGLVILPLIAQAAILHSGWRAGWLAVGIAVLVIGFIPSLLFMVRRPEDLGLCRTARLRGTFATDRRRPEPRLHPCTGVAHARHSGCSACSRCSPIRCRPASACIRRRI